MNVFVGVVSILLALAFLAAGSMKLLRPKDKLIEKGLTWAEDFPPLAVKGIGLAEVLGAIGLLLPGLVHIATVLTPLAALGLAIAMAGAVIVHVRRNEIPGAIPSAVLLVLAAFVAWARFGPYSL
jgi:uncharacterized membrane protein YphA (DoxX/SURF4 family)